MSYTCRSGTHCRLPGEARVVEVLAALHSMFLWRDIRRKKVWTANQSHGIWCLKNPILVQKKNPIPLVFSLLQLLLCWRKRNFAGVWFVLQSSILFIPIYSRCWIIILPSSFSFPFGDETPRSLTHEKTEKKGLNSLRRGQLPLTACVTSACVTVNDVSGERVGTLSSSISSNSNWCHTCSSLNLRILLVSSSKWRSLILQIALPSKLLSSDARRRELPSLLIMWKEEFVKMSGGQTLIPIISDLISTSEKWIPGIKEIEFLCRKQRWNSFCFPSTCKMWWIFGKGIGWRKQVDLECKNRMNQEQKHLNASKTVSILFL